MIATPASAPFFGRRVVAAAFIMAMFGWGHGFYGLTVYLQTVQEARGWSVSLISMAVTGHFLVGAVTAGNLPALYRRFGLPRVTTGGAVVLALGLLGWSLAREPWHLFAAAATTGAGWVTMAAVAVNAVVSPWFEAGRPRALSAAYNGASIGGAVFVPLWVVGIAHLGFAPMAGALGLATVIVVALLSARVFAHTPATLRQAPDGVAGPGGSLPGGPAPAAAPLPARRPWRDRRLATLAAGMALCLVAQIGLFAHLFGLIVPALGAQRAGLVLSLAPVAAILGRIASARLMTAGRDRRRLAALSIGVQILGTAVLLTAGTGHAACVLLGVVLFGLGIGNATSLPPLIAQAEFARPDVARVVALIVAASQATYAFAPALFGLLRDAPAFGLAGSTAVFAATILAQSAAIAAFLAGRAPGSAATSPVPR